MPKSAKGWLTKAAQVIVVAVALWCFIGSAATCITDITVGRTLYDKNGVTIVFYPIAGKAQITNLSDEAIYCSYIEGSVDDTDKIHYSNTFGHIGEVPANESLSESGLHSEAYIFVVEYEDSGARDTARYEYYG